MSKVLAFPGAKPEPRELDLTALVARLDHIAAQAQPTQNTYGVRVGDLFYASFGYDMTINNFYQVVGLKAKATVTLRRIAADKVTGGGITGDERPIRGHFIGDPIDKRACFSGGCLRIPAPDLHNQSLYPTTDDKLHYYNTMD
ncbi:MAG: hypothetical protein LLF96_06785 [Eubacteriales bacterium]|nr:hypothetical protein [Eubacteriales bacterium]